MNSKLKLLGMMVILMAALPAATAAASGAPADHTSAAVMTHPSQGTVTVVEGASAKLVANDAGITITMQTHGLDWLHAHTLWVIIINRPDLCLDAPAPCTPNDVLTRTDIVEANVVYGGGRVVRSHTTSFGTHLPVGEIQGGWYDYPLVDPRRAQVHLVVNDHGPMIPGLTLEMTRTYRAGCTDASIPPLFPDTARADGTPGPNQCRLMQTVLFED